MDSVTGLNTPAMVPTVRGDCELVDSFCSSSGTCAGSSYTKKSRRLVKRLRWSVFSDSMVAVIAAVDALEFVCNKSLVDGRWRLAGHRGDSFSGLRSESISVLQQNWTASAPSKF